MIVADLFWGWNTDDADQTDSHRFKTYTNCPPLEEVAEGWRRKRSGDGTQMTLIKQICTGRNQT